MSWTIKPVSLFAAVGLLAISLSATSASSVEDAVAERIKPVSNTCMSGDDCAAAPVAAAPAEPRTGQQVYDKTCFTCHAAGVSGAPKFSHADEWAPRIAKGVDTLYTHAWNGFTGDKGMMPAKGLCMDCSEDEIKGAVDYMVENSK